MEYIAEIRGLKKYYGGRLALDIPELLLEKGKSYALIGVNGCGKTTLLRILAGVLPPDEGEVVVKTAQVGYMPQRPYAFGYTVQKNVALAVRDKTLRQTRAAQALADVGLEALSKKRGDALSGGEAQRMAFARILAADSELVLLDEPTASADIAAGERLEKALADYLAAGERSLVFATHTPLQAASLAREIILLDGGKIAERGEAQKLLHCPETDCAKSFLSHWRL